MVDDSIIGKTLGQLGEIAKQAGKQLTNLPGQMAGEAADEVKETKQEPSSSKTSEKDETKKVVESLYAKSTDAKVPEKEDEEKKMLELKQKLHKESYYDPTFNPPKKQGERPAEKVENEKMQEMQDLQKKEEKKTPPLAIQRASERVEKFPGASG